MGTFGDDLQMGLLCHVSLVLEIQTHKDIETFSNI